MRGHLQVGFFDWEAETNHCISPTTKGFVQSQDNCVISVLALWRKKLRTFTDCNHPASSTTWKRDFAFTLHPGICTWYRNIHQNRWSQSSVKFRLVETYFFNWGKIDYLLQSLQNYSRGINRHKLLAAWCIWRHLNTEHLEWTIQFVSCLDDSGCLERTWKYRVRYIIAAAKISVNAKRSCTQNVMQNVSRQRQSKFREKFPRSCLTVVGHQRIGELLQTHVCFLIGSLGRLEPGKQQMSLFCGKGEKPLSKLREPWRRWKLSTSWHSQGKSQHIVDAGPSVLAVVQNSQPVVVFRYVSPLVSTDLNVTTTHYQRDVLSRFQFKQRWGKPGACLHFRLSWLQDTGNLLQTLPSPKMCWSELVSSSGQTGFRTSLLDSVHLQEIQLSGIFCSHATPPAQRSKC